MSRKPMSRPTRRSDWMLLLVTSIHNLSYVLTNALEGAVTLVDNHIRHKDDAELAWQEFTLDLETLDTKEE